MELYRREIAFVLNQRNFVASIAAAVERFNAIWYFSLMKAASPKRGRFICNYQRLTYHLPTYNTHKRYAGTPFICTLI